MFAPDNYSYHELLYRGTRTRVHRASNAEKQEYAIKVVLNCHDIGQNEARVLRRLTHPNIVKFYESFTFRSDFYLVFEYLGKNDLLNMVNEGDITEKMTLSIMRQLCAGLQYAHQQEILHRDIKLDNLFYQPATDQLKIIDWAFAVHLPPGAVIEKVAGTLNWSAPEIFGRVPYISYCNDVWSVALVFYCLLVGLHPFDSDDDCTVVQKIRSCDITYQAVPEPYQNLLAQFFVPHTERPTLTVLQQHLNLLLA